MKAVQGDTLRLSVLFGTIYFVQGVAEPTEGLIAQPVRSLLVDWELSQRHLGLFAFAIGLPWCFKPLYGLMTDFVPLFGSRRKSYLILTSVVASGSLLALYFFPSWRAGSTPLVLALVLPTLAISFADVVADAYMVETGQPRGLTGRLQSVQWAALYSASILTGFIGGWLSEHKLQHYGFLICGGSCVVTLLLALFAVKEPHAPPLDRNVRGAWRGLIEAARSPLVLSLGGFLFLWNFNPFSTTVLYMHMTQKMGMNETFYGQTISYMAAASVVASIAYGFYCRRLPLCTMVHGSIVLGILSTLAYWALHDERSAILITLAVGLIYMTATLVQLDLAARASPPQLAGTVFAILMSVSNFSLLLSTWAGGYLYDWIEAGSSSQTAFHALVGIGGLATALCWFIAPYLLRVMPETAAAQNQHESNPAR